MCKAVVLYISSYEVMHLNIKKTATVGILAALICVFSPLSVPVGAIPISFSTLAIYIVSGSVSKKYSVTAVAVYILIGAAGLPVFSSFTGGLQCITGYTGGYIIGYIPCAFIIGMLTDKFENSRIIYPLSMIAGTVICYFCGTLWYAYRAECGLSEALAICVLPFIIGDIIKITAASFTGITLKKRIKNINI